MALATVDASRPSKWPDPSIKICWERETQRVQIPQISHESNRTIVGCNTTNTQFRFLKFIIKFKTVEHSQQTFSNPIFPGSWTTWSRENAREPSPVSEHAQRCRRWTSNSCAKIWPLKRRRREGGENLVIVRRSPLLTEWRSKIPCKSLQRKWNPLKRGAMPYPHRRTMNLTFNTQNWWVISLWLRLWRRSRYPFQFIRMARQAERDWYTSLGSTSLHGPRDKPNTKGGETESWKDLGIKQKRLLPTKWMKWSMMLWRWMPQQKTTGHWTAMAAGRCPYRGKGNYQRVLDDRRDLCGLLWFSYIQYHLHILFAWLNQGSAHTDWRWSAPTTTQPFYHSLKHFLPPLTSPKTLKCYSRCIFIA